MDSPKGFWKQNDTLNDPNDRRTAKKPGVIAGFFHYYELFERNFFINAR